MTGMPWLTVLWAVPMVGATLVVYQGGSWPGWLRTVLLVLALPVAVVPETWT